MSAPVSRTIAVAALAALLALGSTPAFAISVNSNYIPGTDFTKYRTYRWVKVEGVRVDPITEKQIRQAVDTQLAAKGWTRTEDPSADAWVGYQIDVEREYRVNYYGGYGYGWGWGGAPASAHTSTVDRGTLTLDIYDGDAKQMLWRGSATDTIRRKSTPEKRQQRLDKAAAKLLRNFPPE
jgi:hypothetical protein